MTEPNVEAYVVSDFVCHSVSQSLYSIGTMAFLKGLAYFSLFLDFLLRQNRIVGAPGGLVGLERAWSKEECEGHRSHTGKFESVSFPIYWVEVSVGSL